jgi:hypothetical protein
MSNGARVNVVAYDPASKRAQESDGRIFPSCFESLHGSLKSGYLYLLLELEIRQACQFLLILVASPLRVLQVANCP